MAFLEARTDFQKLLDDEQGTLFPLVFKPLEEGSSLAEALAANRAWVDSKLIKSGAILFRGFSVQTPQDFNKVVEAVGFVEYPYIEGGGSAPRTRVFGKVLTVNEKYPTDQDMGFHSEACYLETHPTRVMFFCEIPPPKGTGGSTPIVHGSSVYKRLMAEHRSLMEELEGGFNCIRPESGQRVNRRELVGFKKDRAGRMSWFNSLGYLLVDKVVNWQVQLVNGKVLTGEDLAPCLRVLDEEKVEFAWEKGDVLLVDNTAVQHSRKAYHSTLNAPSRNASTVRRCIREVSLWVWSAVGFKTMIKANNAFSSLWSSKGLTSLQSFQEAKNGCFNVNWWYKFGY